MKKLLIIAGLAVTLALAYAGTAFANAGPHGNYSNPLTAQCAGCHRAHTAVGEPLLKEPSVDELCFSCHGGGSGSALDVLNGRETASGNKLNGGGFNFINGVAVTSNHTVEGINGSDGYQRAWGSGGTDGTGVAGLFECTSCHNPHGSTNYRILKDADNGHGPTTWLSGADAAYTNAYASNQVLETTDQPVDYTRYTDANRAYYTQGIIAFCATCHRQYWTTSGSAGVESTSTGVKANGQPYYMYPGTQDAGDGWGNTERYRHAVSRNYTSATSLPLKFAAPWSDPANSTRNGYSCLVCHVAHGTTANATGYSLETPTTDSALLVYDNRGVCRACHQKTK